MNGKKTKELRKIYRELVEQERLPRNVTFRNFKNVYKEKRCGA